SSAAVPRPQAGRAAPRAGAVENAQCIPVMHCGGHSVGAITPPGRTRPPRIEARTRRPRMTDTVTREVDETTARIDIPLVTDALLGTWADIRREAREMIKDPAFWRIEGQPMVEHRERTLAQLDLLVQHGASMRAYPKEHGGLDNQGGNLAGFQELLLADPSLQIKSGVQWGLFAAAILQLGTKTHHDRWLRDAGEMRL